MTPPGYTLLRRGSVRVLVRDDMLTRLGAWLMAPEIAPLADARPIGSGRGGAFRARVGGGAGIVVRPCRRGGLLGRLLGTIYVGWRARPWRELAVSVAARDRAVPTPAIVAVRVEGWGVYRGVVVTDEAADTVTLADGLRAAGASEERARVARTAGEAVGRLHAAGVQHADLNLHNVLVPTRDGSALVIDLDKARLRSAPLADALRRGNLRRLRRSWHRIMDGRPVPEDVEAAFRTGYESASGTSCGC